LVLPLRILGTTVNPHRTPVNPASLEKLRNSIADVCLVGGVEEEDGVVCPGVLNPSGELVARHHGSGGIVGGTEVGDVDFALGGLGGEVCLGGGADVDEALVLSALAGFAGVTGHYVGVDVDRVCRIGDGDGVVLAEDVEDVGGVALGAVGDEDFIS
jgi:hypothetical protein